MSQPDLVLRKRFFGHALGMLCVLITTGALGQNSMVGDGFGGRLWYRPTNYTVGSYSAFSLCYGDPCDSANNQLYGWGGDNNGELGNGTGSNCSIAPEPIQEMGNVRYYSTGYWMGAIKNDGTGWVWQDPFLPVPTQVITDVKFVDASSAVVSFVKTDGTIWSIGVNAFGQFGDGTISGATITPVQMIGVTNAVRVAVGLFTNYALLNDGTVMACGASTHGLMGISDVQDTSTYNPNAIPVPGLSNIVDIKASSLSTAALDANGDVYTWGQGGYTGDGDWVVDSIPELVPGLNDIVAISACTDGVHTLALDVDGRCYAFGNYNFSSSELVPVLIATDVVDIMAGETFSYIVKSDGTLWAAGWSLCGSVFLDQPNHGQTDPQLDLIQLDPSAVPGSCPIVGTVAIPTATCNSGTITVHHFGGQEPYSYDIGTGPQPSNVFTEVPLGTYSVTVTDANGCVITVPCTVDPNGSVPIVADTVSVTTCTEEGYTLPSGTTVFASGIYTDTVYSDLGCDTVRSYNVTLNDGYPLLNWQITLCEGEVYTLPNGELATAPGEFFIDTLEYENACDTLFSVSLILSTSPPLEIFAYATDSVITQGEGTLLIAMTGDSYSWFPSGTLSCSDCQMPTATPTETTEYCVILDDGNICSPDTACVEIVVLPATRPLCTPDNIFVPSAFSPNANDKNDLQCVLGAECIASMRLSLYNRWGNKVFETSDPEACWDGTYNGLALDPAVFVYYLIATLNNGDTLERQGNVTLIR